MLLYALLTLAFASASATLLLNLATHRNSPARSTKSTTSHACGALSACKHTVSGSFSLPSRGAFHRSLTVLFSIGHMVVFSLRRWSSYIPSRFLVSRCTLELPMPWIRFAYGDFTLFVLLFQNSSASHPTCNVGVLYPVRIATYGLGSSDFARHYFRNRSFFLFLQVLRCFSSLGSPRKTMDSSYDTTALPVVRSRIRTSADQCLCAAPRSFSQLVTSFFGAMYQGIPRKPFVA